MRGHNAYGGCMYAVSSRLPSETAECKRLINIKSYRCYGSSDQSPKEIKKLQLNFLLNGKDGIRPHSNVGLGIGL